MSVPYKTPALPSTGMRRMAQKGRCFAPFTAAVQPYASTSACSPRNVASSAAAAAAVASPSSSSTIGEVGTIAAIQRDLRSKQRSAAEVMKQYLDTLQQREPHVKSFISVAAEQAMQQAKALDARIASEGVEGLGPLAGVPVAVKDNICTRGVRTTAGSRILENYAPPFDATAVSRMTGAGAILVGKANCDEFGMGSSCENSAYQVTHNPRDLSKVPGGSSGGSASAVAAQQCVAALGSDTGGSIRQPASFCGVVGLKPSYGRVSRYGLVSYASSLDCVGPLGGSVQDVATMLGAIAGHDPLDATSSTVPPPSLLVLPPKAQLSSRPLAGRRVAIVRDTLGPGCAEEVQGAVQAAARHLEQLGAVVEEISLPTFQHGLPAYYVLAVSEASSNLARYDGVRYGLRDKAAKDLNAMYSQTRAEGLGAEVKRRILMGTYALSAGYYDAVYKRAQQVRTLIGQELSQALSRYDALLSPAAPTLAYGIGEKSSDPLAMYLGDLATVNVNLAGLPALVLPVAYAQSKAGSPALPVGLQMIGRSMGEADLLHLGHVLEQTLDLQHPALPAPLA